MLELSISQRALVSHLVPDNSGGGAYAYLDPSDPEQRALIVHGLDAAGKTAHRYPALHRALDEIAPPPPVGEVDDARHVDLGCDRSAQRATASGWISSRGGAYISGAITTVIDADSGASLAEGVATQVGGTLVRTATQSASAQPGIDRMTAVTLFHTQQSPDLPPRFGVVTTTRAGLTATLGSGPPPPTDPRHINTPTSGPVKIGLCRSPQHVNTDVDYSYPSAADVDPDRMVVPFTGSCKLPYRSAVTLDNPICTDTRLYVSAANAYLKLLSGYQIPMLGASGSTVSWSAPFDGKNINVTGSLQYEASMQANDTQTEFLFEFQVPVQNQIAPIYRFAYCSYKWPGGQPSPNCTTIPELTYWWHCLGPDTTVTLADGSQRPIREVDNACVVRLGDGKGDAAVEATSRAPHGGGEPARRLRTEGGRSLLLSELHPVMTTRGPVAARDLAVGDEVLADGGADLVASCEREAYDGLVCNLKLVEDGSVRSFLANGIAVGDHLAQAAHFHARRHDPDLVLPTLPESHHQDWLSALADATAS
jgi:hypothetical protein